MPDPHVVLLSDPAAADPALTGGKGASLARLTLAGLPVPPGFAVVPAAYRAFAEGIACAPPGPDGGPEAVEAWAAAQRAALLERSLPMGVEAAIRAALAAMPGHASFAVRSSGTMEDLAEAAFAGQHDTYLGIVGAEAVLDAVRQCFASLWTGRAVSYRAGRGLDHGSASMAVVVQAMVDARAAGVAFTLDPVSGRPDVVVVESAFGLGETVVSGEGATDQFALAKDGLALRSSRIGAKERALRLGAGGPAYQDLGAPGAEPSLAAADLADVGRLALAAEALAGFPQDVEWAVADQAWLLQSRPVTVIPERWTRDESAERFPSPVTPLTWDLVEEGFHDALRHSFALMGLPPFSGRWFARIGQYVYGNQNVVEAYMGRSPLARAAWTSCARRCRRSAAASPGWSSCPPAGRSTSTST